mgnify:CR=1 FL=1
MSITEKFSLEGKVALVTGGSSIYPFLSLRSGTKRYENVFLSLFF